VNRVPPVLARPWLTVSMLAIAMVTTACGAGAATPGASVVTPPSATTPSTTTAPASPHPTVAGCVPECLRQGGTGTHPIPAGSYTTSSFFAGMLTITLDDGWTVGDGTNELVFEHPGPPDWFIFVWVDPYPVKDLHRVQGVERTPSAISAWLLANPTLIGKVAPATTVGNGLPAVVVDLAVSAKATKEVSDCPDICTNYLGFENGPSAHGLARPGVARVYFAPSPTGANLIF